jgi:hypothetical protein
MGSVTNLAEFRRAKDDVRPRPAPAERPTVPLLDILGRDYSKVEEKVFAATKIKELLAYSLGEEDGWAELVLDMLASACEMEGKQPGRFQDAALALKWHLADRMDAGNERELADALMLVKLVEKSLGNPKDGSQ